MKYSLGILGGGGYPVNNAGGELFDPIDDGDFTDLRAAKKAAAELAIVLANGGNGEVRVGITRAATEYSVIPNLVGEARANAGQRRVRWSC